MGSVARMTWPYGAAVKKDWNTMKFYDLHKEFVTAPLTVTGDTALHIAVHSGDGQFVNSLLNQILGDSKCSESPLLFHPFFKELAPNRRKNEYGNTALHEAASSRNLKMIELLLNYDEALLKVKNNRGETPLFQAAAFGRTKVVRYLALRVDDLGIHCK